MKKFTKICLIIAAVCLLCGTGITAAAAAKGARIQDLPHIVFANDWDNRFSHWDDLRDRDDQNDMDDYNDMDDHSYADGHNDTDDHSDLYDHDDSDDDWDYQSWKDEASDEIQADIESAMAELDAYWNSPFQAIKTQSFQNVKDLDLEVNDCGIQFISTKPATEGEKNQIQVKVGEGTGAYHMSMEGNKLKIKSSFREHYLSLFREGHIKWPDEARRIQVLIPEGYHFDEVEISGKGAVVNVDQLQSKKLDAEMSAGIMKIHNGNVDSFDGDFNVGDFLYEGEINRKADVDCNVGAVQLALNGKKTDYDYRVRTTLGSIYLGDEGYTGMRNHDFENTGIDKKLDLSCKLGDIKVTFKNQ